MSEKQLAQAAPKSAETSFTLRWVLAHEPVSVFEEAAKSFSKTMTERTDAAVKVRVMTASEFAPNGIPSPLHVAWSLFSGRLEMTQTYTPLMGSFSPAFWSLDLPFLFRDHEHASRVLDGAIGQRLLQSLLPFNCRGLAFTYSGGFRMAATTSRPIEKWEDLQGLRMRTSPSPVSVETMRAFGAEAVPQASADIPGAVESGAIDGAETTYPRYWALGQQKGLRVVSETWHSLFLTVLAVNERFYQALPPSYRESLVEAARHTAVMERAHSVADGERVRREAAASGVKIVQMSERERERMAEKARPLHAKYAPLFGQDFLDAVAKA